MTRGRWAWLAVITVVVAGLFAPASDAGSRGRKQATVPCASLPDWVREAASREIPAAGLKDYVWLHEELEVEPIQGGGVVRRVRMALRVLKAAGLDDASRWAVSYRSDDRVESIGAWTVSADGEACRVADSKKDVADYPAVDGYSVFEDSRRRVITAPAAAVGSVVAFESVVTKALDLGTDGFTFGSADRVTAFSRFRLTVPEGWSWDIVGERTEEFGVEVEEDEQGATYTLRDVPPLPKMDMRPPPRELQASLWARWWDGLRRGYTDWNAVGTWYRDLADPVLEDAERTRELAATMRPKGREDWRTALEQVYGFAARDVRYVSIQVGVGGYKPFSPDTVFETRYGDCKAKSFLVRAMVEAWGGTAYPVLIRTRDLGPVDVEVPTPGQFNHAVVAVALPDGVGDDLWSAVDAEDLGRIVFLDATASDSSPWDLPTGIQGTTGAVVTPDGLTLVTLPIQPPEVAETERVLRGTITDLGVLETATLRERWTGPRASRVRSYYGGMSDRDLATAVATDLQDRFPATKVVSYRIEGLDDVASDVVEDIELAGGRIGQRIDDLLIVEPAAVAYGVYRASLPPPPRLYDLDLGHARLERVTSELIVPDGWQPEALPDPVEIAGDDLAVEARWGFEDGQLTYERTARLLSSRVPPERYEAFRADLRRLHGADSRSVVFVRP